MQDLRPNLLRPILAAPVLLLAAACASTAETRVVDLGRGERSFEFIYTASLPAVPDGAKDVKLWIPLPLSTPEQEVSDVRVEASHPYVEHPIEHGFGRSLCVRSDGEPVRVTTRFVVTRHETHGGGSASGEELAAALAPDAMVPLSGKVAAVAASLPTPEDPLAAGKTLYLHTLDRMHYDKPDGGEWGRGDSEWACDSRYGNCTDFHSYFMALARNKDIPARFEMGFPIPAAAAGEEATVGGYHCWAFFWTNDHGWVPVDISEADKAPEKAEYFFGTLDENRVTMTGGRDVLLTPRPARGALNFFVYPYAEVDGVEAKVERSFRCRGR